MNFHLQIRFTYLGKSLEAKSEKEEKTGVVNTVVYSRNDFLLSGSEQDNVVRVWHPRRSKSVELSGNAAGFVDGLICFFICSVCVCFWHH